MPSPTWRVVGVLQLASTLDSGSTRAASASIKTASVFVPPIYQLEHRPYLWELQSGGRWLTHVDANYGAQVRLRIIA